MKKLVSVLGSILLILFLAACNEKADPVSGDKEAKADETKKVEKELTAEEVYEKMVEASEEVKSFAMNMKIKQDMTSPDEDGNVAIEMNTDTEIIQEPFSLFQSIEMDMDGAGLEAQKQKMDQYLTEEGFFMYDSANDVWGKSTQEYSEVATQFNAQQTNQFDTLKDLDTFVDDFTFKQDTSQYILGLSGNDDKMNEFVQKSMPANMQDLTQGIENMEVSNVDYEILIDKETFLPTVMNVSMDINMQTGGATVLLKQTVESSYDKYNEIKEIVVPEKAKDNPQEFDLNANL